MDTIEANISKLGYALPDEASPVANYVPAVSVGETGLVYTSGHIPRRDDGTFITGKLGADISIEDAYDAAQRTALSLLGTLKATITDLDRIERIVKLLTMVNCTPNFADHSSVANGASDLLVEIFGDSGRHARSAVGMSALPMGVCVEIEMIVQVSNYGNS
tara:strand:+ start:64 stop:546 length:483 start_codon:yes stop_codon:yes gene_type:complete